MMNLKWLTIEPGKRLSLTVYTAPLCARLGKRAAKNGRTTEVLTAVFGENTVLLVDSAAAPYQLPGYRLSLVERDLDESSKARMWLSDPLVDGFATLPLVIGKPAQCFMYNIVGLIAPADYISAISKLALDDAGARIFSGPEFIYAQPAGRLASPCLFQAKE